MKHLYLSEKIANKTGEVNIHGNNANNYNYRQSLLIISDLERIAKALCIKIKEDDYKYIQVPERRFDGEDKDFRAGTISTKWNTLAQIYQYNGYLLSSLDNQDQDLINYRNKIRIIRIFKYWSAKNYSSKKSRILQALKNNPDLFRDYNLYLIELLEMYNFNQFNQAKSQLTYNLLSKCIIPSDNLLKKITKLQ